MLTAIVVTVVTSLFLGLGAVLILRTCVVQVDASTALVVHRSSGPARVTFTNTIVVPVVQHAERVDLSEKLVVVERDGARGVLLRDGLRAAVRVEFGLSIRPTAADVLEVAQTIGAARSFDADTVRELFQARCDEAIQAVCRRLSLEEIVAQQADVRDAILTYLGHDLGGWEVSHVTIPRIRQVPPAELDPNSVLDAEGIRACAARTAALGDEVRRLVEVEAGERVKGWRTFAGFLASASQTDLEHVLGELLIRVGVAAKHAEALPDPFARLLPRIETLLARTSLAGDIEKASASASDLGG